MKYRLITFFLLTILIVLCSYSFSQNSTLESNEIKRLLKEISIKAIQLGDYNFAKEQIDSAWIGYKPNLRIEIEQIEKKLSIKFPSDYVDFLLITNGFHAANSVEPNFCKLNEIDFLKNVDSELYEIWIKTGNVEVGNKLKTAIKVGGFDEEQYFFLIPPSKKNPNWEYWVFAAWAPGETVYTSLIDYLKSVLETINVLIENKN